MEKESKYYDKVYSISKEYAKTPNESIYANIWRTVVDWVGNGGIYEIGCGSGVTILK